MYFVDDKEPANDCESSTKLHDTDSPGFQIDMCLHNNEIIQLNKSWVQSDTRTYNYRWLPYVIYK